MSRTALDQREPERHLLEPAQRHGEHVEHIPGREFALRGYDTTLAGLLSQSLVGMVALTGGSGGWRSGCRSRAKSRRTGAPAWNGLSHLEHSPQLRDVR